MWYTSGTDSILHSRCIPKITTKLQAVHHFYPQFCWYVSSQSRIYFQLDFDLVLCFVLNCHNGVIISRKNVVHLWYGLYLAQLPGIIFHCYLWLCKHQLSLSLVQQRYKRLSRHNLWQVYQKRSVCCICFILSMKVENWIR